VLQGIKGLLGMMVVVLADVFCLEAAYTCCVNSKLWLETTTPNLPPFLKIISVLEMKISYSLPGKHSDTIHVLFYPEEDANDGAEHVPVVSIRSAANHHRIQVSEKVASSNMTPTGVVLDLTNWLIIFLTGHILG
jgi:hypothetical protein